MTAETHLIRLSFPSKVTSYSTRLRTSQTSLCNSAASSFVFSDTSSNTSSTPLLTRSAMSFQPTCRIHQLSVRYLISTCSLTSPSSSPSPAARSSMSSKLPIPPPNRSEDIEVAASNRSRSRSSRSNCKIECTYLERARRVNWMLVNRERRVVA